VVVFLGFKTDKRNSDICTIDYPFLVRPRVEDWVPYFASSWVRTVRVSLKPGRSRTKSGEFMDAIHLEDTASKGRSGRVIPMNEELRTALRDYAETVWMPILPRLIEGRATFSVHSHQGTCTRIRVKATYWEN
jgi:hypothetical protein